MVEKELQHLIQGCKKQDRQSQKLLYQVLHGFAMGVCLRYAHNEHEASEVLNDGFFKAFTNIERYDDKLPFKPWLRKIMYHAAIDYYRAGLKWANREDLEKLNPVMYEASVEQKLSYDDLLNMVQRLPPTYRMVFNLYAIDGYSHEEIGGMLGIGTGTSRSNLYKARLKLQQMLSQPQSLIVLLIWKYKTEAFKRLAVNEMLHSKFGRL
ncbi:RNA polymerase sigma factor [Mangrovibacterium lignilyticum]|uniref:RNA polymerase sigma factor n=1 Tax=Mangrovibacterium lignilyticum TaxID=2668052 RepID=UPI0013D23A08|nr:RNA polymerase sigma factor [Mangrovibacterium lignilyticum]